MTKAQICPLCRSAAHESRFGAPCHECLPPHPIFKLEGALFVNRLPMDLHVLDAQDQMRTPRDVPAGRERVRPKVPPKALGRRGTRKAWKRHHPPYWRNLFRYREPGDIVVIAGSARVSPMLATQMNYPPPDLWIVTPAQKEMIVRLWTEKGRTSA